MHYLSWAKEKIPLCFIKGLSYSKRARIIEHSGGYSRSIGFEASEISMQIEITRALCAAFGLDFDLEISKIMAIRPSKRSEAGVVRIGGHPLYPELLFSPTNVNTTLNSDGTPGISVYACDIVLSGVAAAKEVSRKRTLEAEPENSVPIASLRTNGQRMVFQDGSQITLMKTTPHGCELEVILGNDSNTASRAGFIEAVIEQGGVVELDLPIGKVCYNIIIAALIGNILSVSGTIFPESASKTITKTYKKNNLDKIVSDLLLMCGIDDYEVKVQGMVDYYGLMTTPLQALKQLQESCGFVVSARGNKVTVASLPSTISAQKEIEGDILDDSSRERTSSLFWRDGIHEFTPKDKKEGEAHEVRSCFSSDDDSFVQYCMAYKQYDATYIAIQTTIDPAIVQHSQVYINKNGVSIPCLVDFYVLDWLSGTARYECKHLG